MTITDDEPVIDLHSDDYFMRRALDEALRAYQQGEVPVGAVIVSDGPLTGLRGVIDRMDRKKLYIHVDAIPGSVMIEVEPHQVQLEKDTAYSIVTSR